MSVKTISEGAHEKRLLHPSWRREGGRRGGRRRQKEKAEKRAAANGEEGAEGKDGGMESGEGKEGGGFWLRLSEMLTHSHAGLPRLFPLTLPAPE